MNPRTRKTTATVLAGSVALASAAYAIGSQSGGGTSGAATAGAQSKRAFDPAASLAKRLGVSEQKLRAAFEDIRKTNPPPGGDPAARLAQALSDALGLPEAKVKEALAKLRAQHESEEAARRTAFAKSLADELGLDASKVSAALEKLRPDGRGPGGHRPPLGGVVMPAPGPPPGGADGDVRRAPGPGPLGPPPGGRGLRLRIGPPPGFVSDLAKELGVDRSKLRAALEKLRPERPKGAPGPGGGPPAAFARDLAKALGADAADVRSALEKLHSQVEADMQARRDKLAEELAARLDLPVQKVKDALAQGPPGPGGP